ncbi:MAG: tRNA (guanosine(37)-N1)-methyltransferase TrmD [Desulfobulbaceae bacterium]|nr:tRNA (guanosine(37)-N1)-methyltransferase TrmD [Desulfobulbaceae bacterium]
MLFDILTIFPELFVSPLQEGILRRAINKGRITVNLHNIRNYAMDKHHMTDDRPFGGGEGMVMKPEPLTACLKEAKKEGEPGQVVLLSPRGAHYTQQTAERLAQYSRLFLVCGRYEGVDERFGELYVDEELSIGDYILTGGELAAMVVIDSVTRLLPGVLGCADSVENDTFSRGLLKHSQYTRPREFEGIEVPEQLLTGNHAAIERYRFLESVKTTLQRRPALLASVAFTAKERKILGKAGLLTQVEQAIGDHGI